MSPVHLEAEYWDKLYRRHEYVYGTAPNQYLLRHASLFQPGMTAFVPGDGEGRNGVWLAKKGLQVVSAERSPWGVAKGMRLARHHDVTVQFECCDLLDWEWPQKQFDVAVALYLHLQPRERKQVHRKLAHCLRPGGFVLLEAFKRSGRHSAKNSGRSDAALYTTALLARDFQRFKILELLENTVLMEEGPMHQGYAKVVRVLAQKR